MDIDQPLSLTELPDLALNNILQYTDERCLFRLSWTNKFWHNRLEKDDFWCQILVGRLDGIDSEICNRLCALSGLSCKSLAISVVATRRYDRRHEHYTRTFQEVVDAVDTRVLGLITFIPERLDLHNNDAQLQQACVDVFRWGLALSKATVNSGQFIWKGRSGRSEQLLSVFYNPISEDLMINVEGESVYTFQDRNSFVEDVMHSINADCWFIALDSDAPDQLLWMNGDDRIDRDEFDSIRDRITEEEVSTIIAASSGLTLGMFYGNDENVGVNYHYRAVQAGSRARKVNPLARYALICHHMNESHNAYSFLNELFLMAKMNPSTLGCELFYDYPKASSWPGWPFNLTERMLG